MCRGTCIAVALFVICTCLWSCTQLHSHPEMGTSAQQQVIREPCFDCIDYSNPKAYLELPVSIGNAEHIRTVASQLKGQTPEISFRAIDQWMNRNLKYDPNAEYDWRNFDQIVDDGTLGGCADHSVVFGALSRACGIPTVWVKTMDYDWIRDFKRNGPTSSWRGHVFLEVYIRNRWMLLDAQGMTLYEDYDWRSHFFPGERYAYDKGGDPYKLILSSRWAVWKKQTAGYFAKFDVSNLPGFDRGRDLSGRCVYIVADNPVWEWVQEACRSQGYKVRRSFNAGFDKYLPEVKGNILIVACVGDCLVLPQEYHVEYLPITEEKIKARLRIKNHGIARRRLDDGTRVIMIFGRDNESLYRAVEALSIEETE